MVNQGDLRDFVDVLNKVQLTRTFADDTSVENGFILGLSEELVLMHVLNDFRIDGYSVFRLSDITSIRSGPVERKWEQMLRDEGVLDQVGIEYDVPLTDIRSLVKALKSRARNIWVDCENCPEADHAGLHVGQIISINNRNFEMREFDTKGKWYSHRFKIPYDSVTHVRIDNPYVDIYSKYLE